ncbi:hypothetical protein [Limosilactobacillus pontis]
MSKAIAFIIGSWCCYCFMIHSYDGAIAILALYILAVVLDPLELKHKKDTTAANSRAQK